MLRRPSEFLLLLLAVGILVPSAVAGPTATNETRSGNRVLHQQLKIMDDGVVHYFVTANDPDGLYPYCVQLRLERRRDGRWRPLRRTRQSFQRDCFRFPGEAEQESVTRAAWDLFLFPGARLARGLNSGTLRAHGLTNLGGDISVRD